MQGQVHAKRVQKLPVIIIICTVVLEACEMTLDFLCINRGTHAVKTRAQLLRRCDSTGSGFPDQKEVYCRRQTASRARVPEDE